MDNNRIDRINELYRKSQSVGLTEEEKLEQSKLRSDYIAAFRRNLRGTLEQISILNPDGSITKVSDQRNRKQQ
jgi:uncharacterized protein YnzC (UPF0291/DUF896 family)